MNQIQDLIEELQAYCHAQGLPHLCALELQSKDITDEQRAWLKDYCQRWEAAADLARADR